MADRQRSCPEQKGPGRRPEPNLGRGWAESMGVRAGGSPSAWLRDHSGVEAEPLSWATRNATLPLQLPRGHTWRWHCISPALEAKDSHLSTPLAAAVHRHGADGAGNATGPWDQESRPSQQSGQRKQGNAVWLDHPS
ncbi:hypothetical protein P7K49_013215 [Saguinus oedipus]|uniref:Uncharacterized protein n=1 Tax=Saguinus oedipus TaxID=9490 RepID=A0ABQ9VF93_SAGOE|nr:hypothetical protein P7K49_013215 [Saguinus oedipus]